jgi:hypothetical protein
VKSRVYIMLDILKGKASTAMQILKSFKGVAVADVLEGHPNILVVVEAANRQSLFEVMMPVLDSVDHITEDVHLLVNRESAAANILNMPNAAIFQKHSVN